MRQQLAALLAAGFLFSTGCNQTPPTTGGNPPPPAPKTNASAPAAVASTVAAAPSNAPSTAAAPSGGPASPAAASPGGASPAVAGSATPTSDGAKKVQDDTGIVFVSETFQSEVKPDGELQLAKGEDLFVALMPMEGDPKSAFDSGMTLLKAIGKDKFKITQEAKENDKDGIKGTFAMGTVDIKGKSADWFCAGIGTGKKSLRLVAIGNDLMKNKDFNDFMNSIKKQ